MRKMVAGIATAALLVGCGATGSGSTTSPTATTTSATATPSATPSAAVSLEAAYEQVIKDVLPSIVQITTKAGLGSGIVYDTKGHIVTNAHVVGEATQMTVTLATGGAERSAKLVKSFPPGDLAVIKVDDANGLTPAKFGDSAKLQVGQVVLAMGNPLGLSGSVTNGIVSALGRTVSGPEEPGFPGATIANAIQTSAAINPGNSGGALVNMAGQVIGIPTLSAVDPNLGGGAAPGIGFAIPSNTATDIAEQIVRDGKVTNTHRAALGIRGSTIVGGTGSPAGVGVVVVEPGSAAKKAGIKPGDVILSVDGQDTPTMAQLAEYLTTRKPGDQVKVEVRLPNGDTETVTVTLGELPGE